MTTTDIQQARIWADELTRLEGLLPGPRAAIEVIQSLPDHWIDVKEVREVINSQLSNYVQGTVGHSVAEDFACKMQALLAPPLPPLPTLAELIEQGNNPAKYQWMQCRIGDTSRTGVITGYDEVGEFEYFTSVTFRDEADTWFDPSLVIPLEGEPKLGWPGDGVEDTPATDDETTPPRPEDVPAEDPWIVLCGGQEWVGVRVSGLDEHVPWTIIRMSGLGYRDVDDSDITLVSRMVPEVKP